MKALIPFFIALAAIALFSSAKAVDFVRQIQLISGQTVVYDIPISSATGTVRSKPIEGNGSIFQLYAYEDQIYSPYTVADVNVGNVAHANVALGSNLVDLNVLGLHLNINLGEESSASSLPKLLAEKAVGSFIPQATVTLSSADPYFPPRTRADQPYRVKVAIDRLPVPGSEVPENVPTKVRLEKSYKLYHPTLHVPAENGSGQGSYSEAFEFNQNGTYTMPSVYQNLPGTSPTRVIGEESHSAYIRLGSGNALAKIGSSTIQIWPVSTAVIQGIQAGKLYYELPQQVQATLTDLYPDSVTYAQIYKGQPSLGRKGHTIPSSVFSINTFAPQNTVVPLQDLIQGVTDDGDYTIEILTITPFNQRQPERVTHLTFQLKRNIKVNASMSTME